MCVTGDSPLNLSLNPIGGSINISNCHKSFQVQTPSSNEVFLGNTSTLNTGSYL